MQRSRSVSAGELPLSPRELVPWTLTVAQSSFAGCLALNPGRFAVRRQRGAQVHPNLLLSADRRGALLNDCQPPEAINADGVYIEIATEVLRACQLEALQALKDFLTILPSPRQIERVLGCAVSQVAAADHQAGIWLCRHAHYLLPELDLEAWARLRLQEYCQMLPPLRDRERPWTVVTLAEVEPLAAPGDYLLFRHLLRLSP